MVWLTQGTVVGKRVIIEEETGSDVEGDEDVDGIVLMGCQDKEDSKDI